MSWSNTAFSLGVVLVCLGGLLMLTPLNEVTVAGLFATPTPTQTATLVPTATPTPSVTPTPTATPTATTQLPCSFRAGLALWHVPAYAVDPVKDGWWDCTGSISPTPTITPTPSITPTPTQTIDEVRLQLAAERDARRAESIDSAVETVTDWIIFAIQICCGSLIAIALLLILAVLLLPWLKRYYKRMAEDGSPPSDSKSSSKASTEPPPTSTNSWSWQSQEAPLPTGPMPFPIPALWKKVFVVVFAWSKTRWTYLFLRGASNADADEVSLSDRFGVVGDDLVAGNLSGITDIKVSNIRGSVLEALGMTGLTVRKDKGQTLIFLDAGGSWYNRVFNKAAVCRWPNETEPGKWYTGASALRQAMWWRVVAADAAKKRRENTNLVREFSLGPTVTPTAPPTSNLAPSASSIYPPWAREND